jgi:ABC-type multidrug transport system fused ATPase/permease subunit
VQLVGGVVTAVIALGVLLSELEADARHIVVLGAFGGGMAYAFKRLRPLFRERGKINAEVTGRLTEALGGIRIVKATPPRSAKSSSSPRARTGCSATSRSR